MSDLPTEAERMVVLASADVVDGVVTSNSPWMKALTESLIAKYGVDGIRRLVQPGLIDAMGDVFTSASGPPHATEIAQVQVQAARDLRQDGEAVMSETSLEKWRRRRERAAQQEADLCALGFTAREAKAQIDDEWARLIWRAHQSGATGPQIGRVLGLGRARAHQLCQRGKRRARCTFPSPLKAACAGGLPETMRAYFEPLRLSEQRDLTEYRRLVAKYGAPAASPADRQGQVPGKDQ